MPNLARLRVDLEGWIGGPGVNSFYFSQGSLFTWDSDTVDALRVQLGAAYDDMSAILDNSVAWTVRADVDIVDVATGEIQNVITGETELVGTGTSIFGQVSRATMIVAAHKTDQFFSGRRLQGRTFVGPVGGDSLTDDGQILINSRQTVNEAMETLYTGTGAKLAIYSRPREASAGPPVVTARTGLYGDVVQSVARTTPGTLRSRKT